MAPPRKVWYGRFARIEWDDDEQVINVVCWITEASDSKHNGRPVVIQLGNKHETLQLIAGASELLNLKKNILPDMPEKMGAEIPKLPNTLG